MRRSRSETTTLARILAQPRTLGEARLMLLRERHVSLADIARDLGKDLSSVSRVNRAQRRSPAIEREIARRLGLSVAKAFPEWGPRTRARRRTRSS